MSERRAQKAAEAIREVVSMSILTELQDPRIRDVTVTYVEVSPDLRYAKVHVSVMGDETRQNLSLRGLQNAAGFLQSKIAHHIDMRYTPKLSFILDQGVKRSIAVAEILREVLPPEGPQDGDEGSPPSPEDHDRGPCPADAAPSPTDAAPPDAAGPPPQP
jgi:ribosome-binding factor A